MTNVEMVRMSAQDKKLSNPSKPSGKTADVKDAGAPQPDEKVQKKETGGKSNPEDETDTDAGDLQSQKLYEDFAARLEWEISQPVPVYEEPSLGQEVQVLNLESAEVQQGNTAENGNADRILAEGELVLEAPAETEKMSGTELETKVAEGAVHDVRISTDESVTPVRLHETRTEQISNIPQPESAGGKAGETSQEMPKDVPQELSGEKRPEDLETQKSEFPRQETEKIPETDRKKTDSGRTEQAGLQSEEEAPKQTQLVSAGESGIRTESHVFQTARPTETVRTTRQELPTDVGKTIASRMPLKNGEMVIELEPANLGKIIVRATYDAGRATVALMTANAKTLEILSRDAGTIAGMIQEKTGQETIVFVPKQEEYPEEEPGKEHGSNGREPRQQNDRKKQQSESFLQQIRLGLV